MADAPATPAVRSVAPADLLATIKDDLGIPPTDASNDVWLQRRIDGVWARMEAYTFRKLCAPPQAFVDDWGELVVQGYHANVPPPIAYPPRATIFLRYFPVASITDIVL